MARTLSIAIKENTYQELKQLVGTGQISKFVNEAVAKELEQKKQDQYRICFYWLKGHAYEVEIVDYH